MRNLLIALAITTALSTTAPAQETVRGAAITTTTETSQPTPTQLWTGLMQGNREFAEEGASCEDVVAERTALRDHQRPEVTILGCADSRVPPELVFNRTLGSLFVVRTAGNIADQFGVASIEYAVAHDFTTLIVVLGHQACGAVHAALDHENPGTPALDALVERIRMSFVDLDWNPDDPAILRTATEKNARSAAASLLAESKVIRDAAASGRLEIVPAYYDFDTGEVRRLD